IQLLHAKKRDAENKRIVPRTARTMLAASLQAASLQKAARLIHACKITLGGPRVFQILAPGCPDAPTWHRAAATLRSCEARTPGEQKSRRERQRNTGQRSMEHFVPSQALVMIPRPAAQSRVLLLDVRSVYPLCFGFQIEELQEALWKHS